LSRRVRGNFVCGCGQPEWARPTLLVLAGKYRYAPEAAGVVEAVGAGVVEAVGAGVTGFKVGQRVAALNAYGAFSEYPHSGSRAFPSNPGRGLGHGCGRGDPELCNQSRAPIRSACAVTRERRTACIATRSAALLNVVSSPAIRTSFRCDSRYRAQALSLPLLHENKTFFHRPFISTSGVR
jgi:hypothetical protein